MNDNEIIIALNEIAENLSTYYKTMLIDLIKDFAEDKDLCPKCGEEFDNDTYDDVVGEDGDTHYSEPVNNKQCDCGYNTIFEEN